MPGMGEGPLDQERHSECGRPRRGRAALSRPPRAAARALSRGGDRCARRLRAAGARAVPRHPAARREAARQGAAGARFGSFAEVIRRRRRGCRSQGARETPPSPTSRSCRRRPAAGARPGEAAWCCRPGRRCSTIAARHGLRRQGAVPHPLSRQAQPAHRRRGAADRHRRPHAGLSARGGQARARIVRHRAHPRAQPPLGRPDALERAPTSR
jgi:hypothetical protein